MRSLYLRAEPGRVEIVAAGCPTEGPGMPAAKRDGPGHGRTSRSGRPRGHSDGRLPNWHRVSRHLASFSGRPRQSEAVAPQLVRFPPRPLPFRARREARTCRYPKVGTPHAPDRCRRLNGGPKVDLGTAEWVAIAGAPVLVVVVAELPPARADVREPLPALVVPWVAD